MGNKELYSEVRCDFYDEERGCWSVDCWKTDNDYEEGVVVAHIYDNGEVVWLEDDARQSQYVQEVIKDKLNEIK